MTGNELVDLLAEAGNGIFVPSFIAETDKKDIAAETLGILISKWAHFDGEDVTKFLVRALYAGLEDSNWHTEAGIFADWFDEMEANGVSIGKILAQYKEANNG